MEENYTRALEKIGISDMVSLTLNREDQLRYSMLKSVFYSASNGHGLTNEDLLLSGGFISKDGSLPDYLEMLHLNSVFEKFKEINWGDVNAAEITEVRKILLTGVYSEGKYLDGLRRYQLSVGPYISIPPEEVGEKFDEIAAILNRSYGSVSENLLNVVEFSVKLIKLHPFEDGDGRTTRLFMNYYLIKNNIQPLHVSEHMRDFWPKSTHAYYLGECLAPELVATIMRIIGNDGARELADRARKLSKKDPFELALRDNILFQTRSIGEDELRKDIVQMYNKAEALNSPELASNALWLCAAGRIRHVGKVLEKAYDSHDARIKANAIYAMSDVDFGKYHDRIRRAAFEDKSEMVRMAAIASMGRNNALSGKMALHLLDNETGKLDSQTVKVSIAKFASVTKDSSNMDILARRLVGSDSTELRIRGYLLMMKHYNDADISAILKGSIVSEPDYIRKGVVIELNRHGKLNNDAIAGVLSELALSDHVMRESLLGDLIVNNKVNRVYDGMFKKILDGDYCDFDKAYSLQMLGKHIGSERLALDAGVDVSRLSGAEKMALNLVKFCEVRDGRNHSELFDMMREQDRKLLFVNSVELGRILKDGSCPALSNGLGTSLSGSLSRTLETLELPGIARDMRENEVVNLRKLVQRVYVDLTNTVGRSHATSSAELKQSARRDKHTTVKG